MSRFTGLSIIFVLIAATANAASLKVIVNDVSPQPVEPGNDLTLRVTYTSVDESAAAVSARLDLREPFVLKTSTEDYEKGFDLCAFCSRTNAYFIYVKPDAKSGIYPVFIRTNQGGSELIRTVNVSVRGKPNIVLFTNAITNTTAATTFLLNIKAENIGSGLAKQIKIVSKSTDFVSLGSSVYIVNSIEPKNQSAISFFISADDDLKAGSYNLPFEINFIDESGISYNTTQNIGAKVVNKGRLNIESIKVVSDSGTPVAGSPISVIVRIENTGYGTASSIESEINCDGQKSKSFLGQLKRDEDAPAVFDLQLTGGRHQCTMTTNYADDLGPHTVTNKFDVSVRNPEFPVTGIIAVIIILGLAYYFLRRRKEMAKRE